MKTKFSGILTLLIAFIVQLTFAQEKTISGKITDPTGMPLPGATVLIKGTSTGTSSDFDGNYSITANQGQTLVFSYVGYSNQELKIGTSNTIDVKLSESAESLEEVVVTALGISREKKSLGYAIQEVNSEELNKSQQTDVVSSLAGRVSGVQLTSSSNMGGSKRIVIRGASSFFGENQPLIVLDGLPLDNSNFNDDATQEGSGGFDYGNTLNDINPDDIESISVLKGTAAALYGSRAANGVIIINTKKGKAGIDSFNINISSSVNFESVYLMPDLQNKYGGGAVISDANGGVDGFEVANINGTDYKVVQYGVDESWGPRYNPNISVLHWDAFSEDYPEDYLKPRPWVAPKHGVRDFFETGVSTVNSLSITKTNSNSGLRFSYTNTKTEGVTPNSEILKNNISLNGNTKISNKLTVVGSMNYARTSALGRPLLGYPASNQPYGSPLGQTLFQWTQRQIDYHRSRKYLNSDGSQRSWNRNSWDDPTPHYSDNHHWAAYESYSDDERDRLFGNFSLSYELTEGLTLGGRVSGDVYTFYNRERVAVGSQAQSYFSETVRNNYEYNFETTLNFDKKLSETFHMTALFGVNKLKQRLHMNKGETSGGLVVAGLYNLLNSAGNVLVDDETTKKNINSIFGSASLGFKNMLFLDLTARNDWSSALPNDNNSYFYPSVSLSFLFSEPLNVSWLNYGKIRAGWASIAKDTDPYNVISTYRFNTDGTFQGTPRIFTPEDLLNSELKPERTETWEVGIETKMFKNRLGIDFTYFNNITTDQIIPLEVSKASGYNGKFINAGEITNNGIEISLNGTPLKTENFSWDVNINYTKINNEVKEILEGIDAMDLGSAPFDGVTLRASVGEPYGQLWGYDFLYDDSGNKLVGDNGYWLRTPNLVPLGSVIPDYNMGIRNSFKYKNLDLTFLFDIQKGGKFYSVSHMWGHYAGIWAPTAAVNDKGNEIRDPVSEDGGIRLNGVTGDVTFNNDGTYTVSNTAPNEKYVSGQGWAARHYHGFGMPSAQSVFDADYIKLRELALGYELNVSKLKHIKSLRFSLYGRNLWTFGLDYKGLDPEVTVNGSGNVQGIEGSFIPTTRTYGFKVQIGI
ncbi:SusC/RagA family TonB-linked outer membrane protein [Aestuariibaculum suncheonense]|uniref:SusC/RagA family TonB-linked outer membrane protein n=1 Tax=Aestuariibaculum suncheonense TaxID=1028745 RepID=A0A8J6UFJ3_9FLAO|nr:SusC/RagA family TonB-linked outer membrane protein [Aestuariibaculum suncheonense]MBD0834314.1 SusC/RagA family TonB-linked outer membrane protein [Aestuariibaculum suncheonense]